MLPVNRDLDVYRGDSWSQAFRLSRDSTAVNLSAVLIAGRARAADGTSKALTVTITNPTGGEFSVKMPTDSLPPGRYDYDIETTESGGTKVTTWVKGTLTVFRDVTNELGV
jgi:hypothetical protein